ncbi:MAG TPA: tetratricopeptide repeat protein, partial [Roseiarcus sp.]|nr:tetratricopeptide repeat protein [Roseiarcus sp.]
ALAGIYRNIGETYSQMHQYADVVAYEEAAMALGGKVADEVLLCDGYEKLKKYDEAVRACARAVEETGSLRARYWRGRTLREMGNPDAALPDFIAVADSEDYYRSYAAIEVSMIYFNRHNDQSALDALNKYAYLYDVEATGKSDVAVAYNNRCYAYMQLGELKKALDDCTASLKYDSLPDAYRKQQELIKRLDEKQTGL